MIKKHILIATRETGTCPPGGVFASSFFKDKKNLEVTFFYILQNKAGQEITSMWEENSEDGSSLVTMKLRESQASYANFMVENEFPRENIKQKVGKKKVETFREIIFEGKAGLYDAVVLGHRNITFLEKMVAGTIGHDILSTGITFPIWFCREIAEGRKNVLICLDGSKYSNQTADYVGYMMHNEPNHKVTLLHVSNKSMVNVDTIFDDPKRILIDHGISKRNIKSKLAHSDRVVRTIIDESNKGEYAAVAMCWRGKSAVQKKRKKWFAGETSREVLNTIDKAALWIVP